jgi:hypothetical protein
MNAVTLEGSCRFPGFKTFLNYLLLFPDDYAPCKVELDELVNKKKIEFGQKSRGKVGTILSERMNSISGWRPKGVLVAHLHEHQVRT